MTTGVRCRRYLLYFTDTPSTIVVVCEQLISEYMISQSVGGEQPMLKAVADMFVAQYSDMGQTIAWLPAETMSTVEVIEGEDQPEHRN